MAFLFACLENMFKKTTIILIFFSFFSLGHSAKEGFGYNIAVSNPDLTKINEMLNKDNYNGAIKLLKKEIKKHKLNPDLFNLLGYSYRKNKRYNLAIKNYKKALSIDPNHKRTHNYLGITYLKVGNIEKSREHMQILKKLCDEKCEEYKALKKEINIAVLNEKK